MASMEVSLSEAAARLGKSARQVRYLVQQGQLEARKVGGRWRVTLDASASSPQQVSATARKQARLRAVVEDTLGLEPPRRRYSVRDLKAFSLGAPLHQRLCQHLDAQHPAVTHLRDMLDELAIGCHRYHPAEKAQSYRTARDAASRAVAALALEDAEHADAILQEIEQELMPALAGLLRRVERRR